MVKEILHVLGLTLWLGCPAGKKDTIKSAADGPYAVTGVEGSKSMEENLTEIDRLRGLLGIDKQTFMTRYHVAAQYLRTPALFERLSNLTEIHNPALSPARFYFKDDKLTLIYLEDSATLAAYDRQALKARLGGDGVLLRSRAGKTSNLHVYAQQGVAVSLSDELDFIQIFAPMTQSEYEQTIYEDPGKFIL